MGFGGFWFLTIQFKNEHRKENFLSFDSTCELSTISTITMKKNNLKIALATDWLTNLGGAEKVVATVAELYPEAPIFTTFLNYEKVKVLFPDRKRIHTSWFDRIPFVSRRQMTIAPFLKSAIASLDLSEYDVILSFSSSVAKNITVRKGQKHICYIHTPARYIWQKEDDNRFEKFPRFLRPLINGYLERLKKWDLAQTQSVDKFIANSSETRKRVHNFYGRNAEVLYPPVDFEAFSVCKSVDKKDYFLGLGRFVKYKKFDLLVDTFLEMPERELVLIGDGPERKNLELKVQKSKAKNIRFLGRLPFVDLKKYLSEAKAVLLPQKEDAGIVQLEAFASGVPVVAYEAGGVLDVLQEGVNGTFFVSQTVESLKAGIEKFDSMSFEAQRIRVTVEPFSKSNFQKKYKALVEKN